MDKEAPRITVDDIDRAPTKLPVSSDKTYSSEQYDELLNRVGELGDENENLKELNRSLKIKKEAAEELNKLIGPYANKAYFYMCAYSVAVGFMVFASGADFWLFSSFDLDTSVLEFLVGSTAVTVIGLVGMVLTGIFVGARK